MDISQFDSLKTNTRTLELEGPDDKPLMYDTGETEDSGKKDDAGDPIMVPVLGRVTMELVSSDSSEYTSVYKQQVTNTVQRVGKRGKNKHNVTGDSVAQDKLELLVACTKGWTGWQDGGVDFPYSKRNARALLERLPFVREQVDEFVHDRGNF